MPPPKDPERPENRLLAGLPRIEFESLSGHLELVALPFGTVIYKPGETISHAYFPVSGMISLLATIKGSATVEVGIVGNEGMVGLQYSLECPGRPAEP